MSKFILRWGFNSLGLWLASGLIDRIMFDEGAWPVIIAGLILASVNAFVKPLAVLISLPAILLSLGVFMLFVNGFMVYLADKLYDGLTIDSYFVSILAGIVIGLVNYMVTVLTEGKLQNDG